ncbi:hypothetical protein C8Q78DRAFT_1075400 [Trametes maxima]|nr:hypothetical protein C8Q78DRAFT_1075400 [Trametes maxima]
MASHQRYNDIKDTASEKRELTREKAVVLTANAKEQTKELSTAVKERTTGLANRWKQRYRAATSKKDEEEEEVEEQDKGP